MLDTWHSILRRLQPTVVDGQVTHFGELTAELTAVQTTQVVAPLTDLTLIHVTGVDQAKFLQGQLSCNIHEVTEQQSRLGTHCNAKGRILSFFRLFYYADSYYLVLPTAIAELALAQLQKYALFAKVTLSIDSRWGILGLSGPQAERLLNKQSIAIPAEQNAVISLPELITLRILGPNPTFWLISTYSYLQSLWQSLESDATPIGTLPWRSIEIAMGIPRLSPNTVGLFTPHDLNCQLIHAVSFNKGCYTGQEIIARMQYRATLKQRLYRLSLTGVCQEPQPGEPLYNATQQAVGTFVSIAPTQTGYQALAVIRDQAVKNRDVYFQENRAVIFDNREVDQT